MGQTIRYRRLARSEFMDIYISRDGSHYGAFQQADVEHMLTEGQLLESDLAWCESLDGWVSLGSLINRPNDVQSEATVMPDSLAAAAGAAVAFSLLGPHHSKAERIDLPPTNAAPIYPENIEPDLRVEDLAIPPQLHPQPPSLLPEASEPPVIDAGSADDVITDDEVLMEDMLETEMDIDFDMPDIDIDFDF